MFVNFGISCRDGIISRACEEITADEKTTRVYRRKEALEAWYAGITDNGLRDIVKRKAWRYEGKLPHEFNGEWTPDGFFLLNAYDRREGQPYAESIEAAMQLMSPTL
jgi:hypothetical protein